MNAVNAYICKNRPIQEYAEIAEPEFQYHTFQYHAVQFKQLDFCHLLVTGFYSEVLV